MGVRVPMIVVGGRLCITQKWGQSRLVMTMVRMIMPMRMSV